MAVPARHFVNGAPLEGLPAGLQEAVFGMGCFWGAEKGFWLMPGVVSTSVGYAGGHAQPDVPRGVLGSDRDTQKSCASCSTPPRSATRTSSASSGKATTPQGMRQGNDVGTQYRSAIYTYGDEQQRAAEKSRDDYEKVLRAAGLGAITTEIAPAPEYYFAEEYHQQYLAKNPGGYCGHGGTGVSCPIGVAAARP
jgi:peptide-methionine (S)-S-oxide reductase